MAVFNKYPFTDETLVDSKVFELFGVERSIITKHLKNIYDSSELDQVSTCAKICTEFNKRNRAVSIDRSYNLGLSFQLVIKFSKATQFG